MSSQHAPIQCQALVKQFGTQRAVDDLSFSVAAGTITGFVGANGAGKTTTMRMILGLVSPTSGEALVEGVPYQRLTDPRRTVGAVVDGLGAHPAHTARTHLEILCTSAGLPAGRVDDVLGLVDLSDHAGRRVGGFSLGMRQRLALAGALLGDPRILILDEPVNGLDPPGIIWMRELLRGLAGEGRAVLVSSHLLAELAEVADRVVIIDRGRLVADSTLAELTAGRDVVELHCANPVAVATALHDRGVRSQLETDVLVIQGVTAREVGDLVAALDAGPIYRLSERPTSFEDVYFELAGTLAGPATAPSSERAAS